MTVYAVAPDIVEMALALVALAVGSAIVMVLAAATFARIMISFGWWK